MMSFFDRLWHWYGHKRGLLKVDDATQLLGDVRTDDYGFAFRGTVPPGDCTIIVSKHRFGPLVYNRKLTDAELDELNQSKRWEWEEMRASSLSAPPLMGTEDFSVRFNIKKP